MIKGHYVFNGATFPVWAAAAHSTPGRDPGCPLCLVLWLRLPSFPLWDELLGSWNSVEKSRHAENREPECSLLHSTWPGSVSLLLSDPPLPLLLSEFKLKEPETRWQYSPAMRLSFVYYGICGMEKGSMLLSSPSFLFSSLLFEVLWFHYAQSAGNVWTMKHLSHSPFRVQQPTIWVDGGWWRWRMQKT